MARCDEGRVSMPQCRYKGQTGHSIRYRFRFKIDHNNNLYVGRSCVKGYLTKMFCFYSVHTLVGHKNYNVQIIVLLWACIVQVGIQVGTKFEQ